jgi:hypothetical protein
MTPIFSSLLREDPSLRAVQFLWRIDPRSGFLSTEHLEFPGQRGSGPNERLARKQARRDSCIGIKPI